MQKKINKKGFSLVELLVVMAIMITLGGVGYRAMSGNKVIARDTARRESIDNIQGALGDYYNKNNYYPQPAIRYEIDPTEENPLGQKNVWGFDPKANNGESEEGEAIATCQFSWDSENQMISTDPEKFACGGYIYDRTGEVIIGWKGTLTEFSGKNSSAKNEDGEYINPITNREDIESKFGEYMTEIPTDPSFKNVQLQEAGVGMFVYSAYRKGIVIGSSAEDDKYTKVGATSYQIAATLENEEAYQSAIVAGNYIIAPKPVSMKNAEGETVYAALPYSLIGSRNKIIMDGQKMQEAPPYTVCAQEDKCSQGKYSEAPWEIECEDPCSPDVGDPTYLGVPYNVIY